jgi:predicted RNase H-like HicB family nuclease
VAALCVRPFQQFEALARFEAPAYPLTMRGEFTAVIEPAEEGGFWAVCPEVPGANGQGDTVEATKQDLAAAIRLIMEDRREDALRGLPGNAIQDVVSVS